MALENVLGMLSINESMNLRFFILSVWSQSIDATYHENILY